MAVNSINHDMEEKKINSYHDSCHDINHNMVSCHDHELAKSDWNYLVNVLETWGVFAPRAVIKKYGGNVCWDAMIKVKDYRPRIPGAYFTKIVRNAKPSVVPTNRKVYKLKPKKSNNLPTQEAYTNYKAARIWINSLTDNDLADSRIKEELEKIKKEFNFG